MKEKSQSGEKKKEDDIYIIIEDNGMGMRKEVLENILKDNNKVPKHGSGVGVINVHSRIQLMFGEQYGLEIYSEPDEGGPGLLSIYRQFHIQRRMRNNWRCRNIYRGGM
ncbi:MAG: sensor histidine kinase [Dorea sp.]